MIIPFYGKYIVHLDSVFVYRLAYFMFYSVIRFFPFSVPFSVPRFSNTPEQSCLTQIKMYLSGSKDLILIRLMCLTESKDNEEEILAVSAVNYIGFGIIYERDRK